MSIKLILTTILGIMTLKAGTMLNCLFSEPEKRQYLNSGQYRKVRHLEFESHRNDSKNLHTDIRNLGNDVKKSVAKYVAEHG
jgi:hypothetical protein